jgi:CheY-like chemotaxis protein
MSDKNENNLSGKKILYVEDDIFFANMLSLKLTNLGCVFKNAANGQEAFLELGKEKADIVLLDLMLPGGMDGFEILEKIKANPDLKKIPVVILSNLSQTEDIQKGLKLGASKYLIKAMVSTGEIIDNIKSVLGSKKS